VHSCHCCRRYVPDVGYKLTQVTFTVHTALGNELDLGKIFATLSFFGFIQGPLTILPKLFAVIAAIMNSAGEPTIREALTSSPYHPPHDCQ
jgi:hypothetical protein